MITNLNPSPSQNTRHLTSIMGNSQKLDGGAMFGNIPKALWNKWIEPDEQNRIPLVCRALLVEEKGKKILLETGIGAFFNPTLKERFGVVENQHVLLNSLTEAGLSHEDIDFVILSHLHFDHAGGLLSEWQENKEPSLLFPNARYLVSKKAWERANFPHLRDRASFIPELTKLLKESERLVVIESDHCDLLGEDYKFIYSEGHTPGMMHTIINMPEGPVIFAADLIPGLPWLHVPTSMGYDRAPEILIDEKKDLLEFVLKTNGRLFYTHDNEIALSRVELDMKGKFVAKYSVREFRKLAS